MERPLEGRRALVTAAADGLGRAYAVALAAAGAHVAACDKDPALDALGAELAAHGGRSLVRTVDVTDTDGMARLVDDAAAAFGGLDLVVNNAGVVGLSDRVTDRVDRALEVFDAVVGVNLRAAYAVGRLCIPFLVRGGGDIVNVTTDHVHTCGYPEILDHADAPDCPWAAEPRGPSGGGVLDAYDASKWGVHGLTQCWARALAPHGVRVNSFGMGATDTPMYRGFMAGRPMPPHVMAPASVAAVLVALIAEGPSGRNADSVQLWMGHPTVLPPVSAIGRLGPIVRQTAP
jgi:NAD(P)-dependent dehydrogenase (short-subunit alcohol dehydrogenase family)